MRPGDKLQATIRVINTGNYDGEEVVQLYLHDLVASITQPVKRLAGFQKISLKAGEAKDVSFTISVDDLKFFSGDLKRIYEPGEFDVMVGGNSKDVKHATFTLTK